MNQQSGIYLTTIVEIVLTYGQNPLHVDIKSCVDIIGYLGLTNGLLVDLHRVDDRGKKIHSFYTVRDVCLHLFGDSTLVVDGVWVLVMNLYSSKYLLRGIVVVVSNFCL